jgi:hypothetical protein
VARLNDTDIAVTTEGCARVLFHAVAVQAFRSQLDDSQCVAAYCAAAPSQHGDVYLRRGSYVTVINRQASPWAVSGTGHRYGNA